MSIAHAPVDEAAQANVFGAWSDLVVGERPAGLVNCYLARADGAVQVVAVWESIEAHDRAIHEEANHPAYRVFEASGLQPSHSLFSVTGHLR